MIRFSLLLFALFHVLVLHSHERKQVFSVGFRVNKVAIDTSFSNNANRIKDLDEFLQDLADDADARVLDVEFCGAASPEGSDQWNRYLARHRLAALERHISSHIDLTEYNVKREESHIPWDYLVDKVSGDTQPYRDEVLSILAETPTLVEYRSGKMIDRRILKLQKLDGGRVWRQLFKQYFASMRNAYVIFTVYDNQRLDAMPEMDLQLLDQPSQAILNRPRPYTQAIQSWEPHLYLKTNLVGLGLLNANVAAEMDIAPHWSFSMPLNYGACDYFKSTVKFRTLSLQPELRYWLKERNDGIFAGAHVGLAYYNYAFGGPYRYQDHKGKSPAAGGGLSLGYRIPLSGNGRWKLEFSAGAGVYSLHYDVFHNTPDFRDGLLVGDVSKVYFGLDQLSISLAYMFDLKR